jgi:KDO2-lipid IV(A) lauroyltransferase
LVTYWGYRLGESAINVLPRGLVLPIAGLIGTATYRLAPAKARLTRENLAHPMGLPADSRPVRAAARRAFRNYAKYLADVMRIGELTDAQAAELVAIENIEILHEARADGAGVILCTVHIGGMDLIGAGLKRFGEKLRVVADDTTYGRLYDHLAEARARQNIFLIGWRNLRALIRALRANENIVLFCDVGYRPGDVPVELHGEATTFPAGPATLAARSGAPILPVACRRVGGERFAARGLPLIRVAGDTPREIQRATQALADALGSVIAQDPGQWYMFRPVWPRSDADRGRARAALEAARRGEDWSRASRRAVGTQQTGLSTPDMVLGT